MCIRDSIPTSRSFALYSEASSSAAAYSSMGCEGQPWKVSDTSHERWTASQRPHKTYAFLCTMKVVCIVLSSTFLYILMCKSVHIVLVTTTVILNYEHICVNYILSVMLQNIQFRNIYFNISFNIKKNCFSGTCKLVFFTQRNVNFLNFLYKAFVYMVISIKVSVCVSAIFFYLSVRQTFSSSS